MRYFIYFLFAAVLFMNAACERDFSPLEKPKNLVRKQVVLFASDRNGGNMNIWMMTPEGKIVRRITHYSKGDYWPSDISPDGKYLLFNRYDAGPLISAIYIMPIEGPEPSEDEELVSGLALAGNFFPDGQKFVYS